MDRWTQERQPGQPEPPGAHPVTAGSAGSPGADGAPQTYEGYPHDDRPHLLFADEAPSEHTAGFVPRGADNRGHPRSAPTQTRAARGRAERRRHRRRRRLVPLVAVLAIGALIAVSYVLVGRVGNNFSSPDYTGSGQGTVQIRVQTGDATDTIGATLLSKGVVKSVRAFVKAAESSGQAQDIQPGVYALPLHASGAAAVAAILNPANRLVSKVTIPEGSTYQQVLQIVGKQTKISDADLSASLSKVGNLGIPDGFPATSAEGYLFPATYDVDPSDTADSVLQAMVAKFSAEAKTLDLTAKAKALGLSGYQVLIIASIAEAEAKYDADRAKVARVIMNRIAAGRPLQVDATSAYAAKLAGKDPASVVYATMVTPYNSYTHPGLPPTPIGNPGVSSLSGALNPPAGTWLYYVNVDAAGHLGFFTDEADFIKAAAICTAKKWGCG